VLYFICGHNLVHGKDVIFSISPFSSIQVEL
jgi:hypothetical protein